MADEITVNQETGTWSVRVGGAVIGESKNALKLTRISGEETIFFPKEDIATAFLDDSDTRNLDQDLGETRYYSIQTKSELIKDAAYGIDTPVSAAQKIQGFLAFNTELTIVSKI